MNDDAKRDDSMNKELPIEGSDLTSELDRLSALVDGEVDAGGLERSCVAWRDNLRLRAAWHSYHLIGDVMRSDQLASAPARDEVFLQAFRDRLADEPVVLAPMPASAAADAEIALPSPWRRAWMTPVVVAAGFAAVAGVMVVSRMAAPSPASSTMSLAAVPASSADVRRATTTLTPGLPAHADPQLVRDARLDRYFEAHREAFVGNALGVPGGSLRSVDTLLPQR